ncbi:MAG TPA: hypothetical protein VKB48_12065 [Candidatus Acidoferrum sp.]|nr:hypothetical protein [Candidatus Acidoferrum sp.]
MNARPIIAPLIKALVFVSLCVAMSGCHSLPANTAPSIEFTKIPPAAQGGRERVDTIAGRVRGARPGQSIVVYAHSGPWWVQPWPDQALIPIRSDSTWSTQTHLGFEYSAMLVDAGYRPPPTMDLAPTQGGMVTTLKIVKGTGTPQYAPTRPLKFSGYDWTIRTIASDRGGMNNLYDPDNAWTDKSGSLHLRIKKKDDRWSCAEVVLTRSLGYGTYNLVVRNTSHMEPAAVLGMLTYDDWAGEQHFREMDISISRWGDPANKKNAQYTVQPFYVPGNLISFTVPPGTLTYSLRWESGRAAFRTFPGSSASGTPVFEHVFTSGVPSPGQEVIYLTFYVVASETNALQNENEVVIPKFEYLP